MKITLLGDSKFELTESTKIEMKDGHSIIKVTRCGVCGSDLPRMFDNKAYFYPIVVGHEFSGYIYDSFERKNIGKRCVIFPIIPCMECEYCKKEQYANCIHYDYYGSRRDGGMQDYLLVKNENILFLPDNVSYEQAAMVEPCAVTLHGIKKANIKPGENVLIYGAGTIGDLCAMWVKSMNANPFLFDIDEDKLSYMEKLGYKRWNKEDVDVVLECTGASKCIVDSILNVKSFGRIVLIGNSSKDVNIDTNVYSKILRKQLSIYGRWNSDYASYSNDWIDTIDAINRNIIDPSLLITHKYSISDAYKMIDMLKEHKEMFIKVMVKMNE